MIKQTLILITVLSFIMVSCSTNSKKDEILVNYVESPGKKGSSLPNLFSNNKKILLSWVSKDGDSSGLQYSELIDGKWSEPTEIISGNDWFVNWADFPAIAENNGQILSHVLKKSSSETFSYDVKLNLFNQIESNWEKDFPLHKDGTKTEHGFVTMVPYKQNSFFVTWLDGRNTGSGDPGEGGHHGAMSIRAAEVSLSGEILNEILLDNKTCECCQTTAAITSNGPIVIYRDRSDEEIRDMSIVRLVDGNWSEPQTVFKDNWKIAGCPVNGPKAAVLGNDLAVTWFTAADNKPAINLVFSTDGGENFDAPINISNVNPAGRVDLVMIDNDNVIVSWMESVESGNQIKIVKVNKSGNKSEPILITTVDSSRRSGFPQMELVNDKVYFAWTEIVNDVSSIKTAFVLLKNI